VKLQAAYMQVNPFYTVGLLNGVVKV